MGEGDGRDEVVRIPGRFESFYRQEYAAVVALVYGLSGSRWAAEDLAQEAFLRALHLEPWYPEPAMADVVEVVPARGSALDTSGDLLAFCNDAECTEVRIRDFRRGETFGGTPPGGGSWWSARFSPDGQRLAMTSETSIVVADSHTGDIIGAARHRVPGLAAASIAWSPDGTQVFAAHSSYGEPEMTIVRYDIGTGSAQSVTLPFGGGSDFVALGAFEAGAFLRDQDQAPESCPAPMSYPTGRIGICGFRF